MSIWKRLLIALALDFVIGFAAGAVHAVTHWDVDFFMGFTVCCTSGWAWTGRLPFEVES